jgi:hypothetical protein
MRAPRLASSCPYHAVIRFERYVREVPMRTRDEAEQFIANALQGPQRGRIVATAVIDTPAHWSVQQAAG